MHMLSETKGMRAFSLPNDVGADMEFTGVLCSENMYHDRANGTVTKQRLFMTDTKDQIYSVVVSNGITKDQRVYKMRVEDDVCRIDNGLFDIALDVSLLTSVVQGLCGVTSEAKTDKFISAMVENLRAVNG